MPTISQMFPFRKLNFVIFAKVPVYFYFKICKSCSYSEKVSTACYGCNALQQAQVPTIVFQFPCALNSSANYEESEGKGILC